ncbi:MULTISPECIES: hypothetical protein [unclassified Crossiella]|uniref:hypothetical protein n=1 Tax=unclassified Crossiella TaxID=2620835 RepID=UPI001FFE7E27|nr:MULTISPECIES: hypothetical protein [unclassified Crossiella]MCK2240569.1 hypothetical protein [Crossiella sp. S99.2]MCK2252980.1 hypothetical protein [Crossiella sp. S99.1]
MYTAEAEQVLVDLLAKKQYKAKLKKVRKALRLLAQASPRRPGLHSHDYKSIPGPGGATLWESYVENRTPSAWRIWWIYGPDDGQITIVTIGPHP